LELLDKEVFGDLAEGTRHVVDLLARVRLRAERRRRPTGSSAGGPGQAASPAAGGDLAAERPTYVLVHIETQAQQQRDFARRMHRYFESLDLRHALPVYPIAVFSFEEPLEPQPAFFDLRLPGLHVLRFRFRAVQLNRLDWRDFMRRKNPVAAALMARMRIAPKERWRVRLQCLRLLATLRLDPARMQLVAGFMDSYLRLGSEERRLFDGGVARLPKVEREKVMELTTSWKEEGIQEGIQQGIQQGLQQGIQEGLERGIQEGLERGRAEGRRHAALDMVLRLIARRLGGVSEAAADLVRSLAVPDLEALAEDLLDFREAADLDRWLERRR
jgi:hypothetical protein